MRNNYYNTSYINFRKKELIYINIVKISIITLYIYAISFIQT